MFFSKKLITKNLRFLVSSALILLVVLLNFYLLSKIVNNSNAPKNYERTIRF